MISNFFCLTSVVIANNWTKHQWTPSQQFAKLHCVFLHLSISKHGLNWCNFLYNFSFFIHWSTHSNAHDGCWHDTPQKFSLSPPHLCKKNWQRGILSGKEKVFKGLDWNGCDFHHAGSMKFNKNWRISTYVVLSQTKGNDLLYPLYPFIFMRTHVIDYSTFRKELKPWS